MATVASPGVFAASNDTVRIAIVGCGNRGTGAIEDCFGSGPGIEIVAIADLFQDRVDACVKRLQKNFANRVKVTPATTFLGFDGYKKVLAMNDVQVVLLATPPAFRPLMVRACVEAGKHIFMEKPGAVDPVGVRSLLKSAELADLKKLSIVVGTQQRYQPQYREVLQRIQDGQIGKVIGGQAYWNWGSTDWHFQKRQPEWSDMEWQIRCWPYFLWLSGDHIVEQHMHNMDILNWAMGTTPVKCVGFGGRQVRTGPEYGNIFDHFVMDYEYPNDLKVLSMCSQIKNSDRRVGERIVGTKGWAWLTRQQGFIRGEQPWEYEGKVRDGLVDEHAALIQSVRDGKPINECKRLAESTMTMIMGRLAAYSGVEVTWDFAMNKSQIDLFPKKLEMGPMEVSPLPIPGKTPLA